MGQRFTSCVCITFWIVLSSRREERNIIMIRVDIRRLPQTVKISPDFAYFSYST